LETKVQGDLGGESIYKNTNRSLCKRRVHGIKIVSVTGAGSDEIAEAKNKFYVRVP
jgi:hypothetical protein